MTQKKQTIIIVIMTIILIGAAAVIGALAWKGRQPEPAAQKASGVYDTNVVLDDPKTLQDAVDEMLQKAAEGQMAIEMQVVANSTDGENFNCYLANSIENSYDMYMVLYLDETGEEIYRSGLIPLGGRIESFQISKKLSPGTHICTVEYNQVEADGVTPHAQVNVGLDLIVSE